MPERRLTQSDLDGLITWSLVRASRQVERVLVEVLAPYGLTPQQFGVLAQLSVDAPLTQADLARAVLVRPQSASAFLDAMETRGLIRRTGDRGRGRRNPVELTDAGSALLAQVWTPVLGTNDLFPAGIDPPEATALNATLLKLLKEAR